MDFYYAHGNDAAIALAEYVAGDVEEFAKLMNEKAIELNLKDTHFVTPHGLDEDEHYTTAYELAVITDYALNIDEIGKIVKTKSYSVNINGHIKNINNTNELLGYIEGVYGVKTGFTNGANRCLVTSVKRENMDLICVVLGADTKKDRGRDSIKLIEYTFSNFQMIDIKFMIEKEFEKIIENTTFNVVKGKSKELQINLEKKDIGVYPIYKEDIKDIRIESEISNEVFAPVNKNDKIGEITIKLEEDIICKIDIIAKNTIPKKKILDYYKDFILNMNNWILEGIMNI